MSTAGKSPADTFYQNAEKPARLIKVICQMIIGLGIAVALILKVYMLVFTDHQCSADLVSIGNQIRCSPTLEIMGYGLALSAGFELAFMLFTDGLNKVVEPVLLGVGATFLLVMADLRLDTVDWQLSLVILSLSTVVGGLFYIRERFVSKADNPQETATKIV